LRKNTKNSYFGGSRSVKVIVVDNSKKPVTELVMISSMSVVYLSATVYTTDKLIAAK